MISLMPVAGKGVAQTCDARSSHVQFARDDLQRATMEGDLTSAQDYADRARREFDQLAGWAGRCGCPPAAAKFEEAATRIRRAQEAESRRELRDVVNAAKPVFEEGLARLQDCRQR